MRDDSIDTVISHIEMGYIVTLAPPPGLMTNIYLMSKGSVTTSPSWSARFSPTLSLRLSTSTP